MNGKDAAFEAWVDGLFASFDRRDRWNEPDYDAAELAPDEAVRRLTRLFRECGTLLAKYPDDNVGRGLSYLRSASLSPYPSAIFDPPPDQLRVACVEAMETLYTDLWYKRCAPEPSAPLDAETGELNGSCYLWWEELRYRGEPAIAARAPLDAAVERVLEGALALPHPACQESALLGLNWWQGRHARAAARIIDAFLARDGAADDYIREYAQIARKGQL